MLVACEDDLDVEEDALEDMVQWVNEPQATGDTCGLQQLIVIPLRGEKKRNIWKQIAAAPSAVRKGGSVSRRASRVCSSSIVTPNVRRSIGRSIKRYVRNGPPSYATRRCSRSLHQRRTVQFASYQCLEVFLRVSLFQTRLYRPCRYIILRLQMRGWGIRIWNTIIRVAGRVFAKGVCTPFM